MVDVSVRLADGVVAGRGLRTWALPGDTGAPANGAAVALGPVDACAADAADAVATLEVLVALGGVVAAGAGVDLGAGFRSARLPGARGDRRDAVLAALRALGPAEAARLGARAAVMVALFGRAVPRPVGAAAGAAVAAGRYGVLGYASAASDVLGPEQLVTLLALDPAAGVDPLRDAVPSTLAAQLGRLLTPLPRPARLRVLVDLWDRVQQTQARANRRFGLL